mgnify:CR=1 FL=1
MTASFLSECNEKVLKRIDSLLPEKNKIISSMRYSALANSKCIRAGLIFSSGKLNRAVPESTLIDMATSIELMHTYSLIHDDLPCMDNDALRRGKPSTHIKFGEATAVLAGNSLLTMAFEILSSSYLKISESSKLSLIKRLSECSGHLGIAGGQYLDLNFEKKKVSKNKIINMEVKKTGKLFSFCCSVAPIIKNRSTKEINFFDKIGSNVGLLFQIADDVIDYQGSSKVAGKKTGKDKKKR